MPRLTFARRGCFTGERRDRNLIGAHAPKRLCVLSLVSTLEIVCAFTGFGGAGLIVALWFLQLSSLGFVAANATALALADQGPRAGSAAALLGAGQFLCAGLAGSALGLGRQLGGTAQAISVLVATGALVALSIRPWRIRG